MSSARVGNSNLSSRLDALCCFCARDFARRFISVCTRVTPQADAAATRPLRRAVSRVRATRLRSWHIEISRGCNWKHQAACWQIPVSKPQSQSLMRPLIRQSTGITCRALLYVLYPLWRRSETDDCNGGLQVTSSVTSAGTGRKRGTFASEERRVATERAQKRGEACERVADYSYTCSTPL